MGVTEEKMERCNIYNHRKYLHTIKFNDNYRIL